MTKPTTEKQLGTLTGPVLLFGGAYSNFHALEALKAEADRLGIPPCNIICTGDTPGYCADPEACLDLIEKWGIHSIAGNVETNLVNGTDDCGCGFGDGSRCDMFAKLWYTYAAKNVSPKNLAFMAGLPDFLRFQYAGKEVVVLHGSPRHQSEFVWASTEAALKAQFCKDVHADVVVAGHCGLPFLDELQVSSGEGRVASGELRVASEARVAAEQIENRESLIENRESRSAARVAAEQIENQISHIAYRISHWVNPGVIGMPANDGTPRTWYAILNDTDGLEVTFHALNYDHEAAKSSMLDDRRLPVSYAATLTTGIWDNTEIMPPTEEALEGIPLNATLLATQLRTRGSAQKTNVKTDRTNRNKPQEMNTYSNPKDLRTFGKIAEWQEEMGNKFFDWYAGVTEGDTALTEREKALIALAVSHAIQCSYCIDAYTTNSLQAGADEEQMMEAVHVAAAVKAGTTLIYARQMQRQVEKITM
ncbi:hypothetical protein A3850_009125 [Lewinella sp. 4G2]|nr:arsenosugar biosynthesis-associated peroxidase-like protein [Lewinella sp. 4G2]OAV44642.1 hypothetical protein A3850_009125 [Lewinella sp. 4G2]